MRGRVEDFRARMSGRHVTGFAIVRMRNRFPGVSVRMFGMRMMRTGQIGKRRPVLSMRRGVKPALSSRTIGVMMQTGLPLVAGCVVMFLVFQMREIVLRFLRRRPDAADNSTFL